MTNMNLIFTELIHYRPNDSEFEQIAYSVPMNTPIHDAKNSIQSIEIGLDF